MEVVFLSLEIKRVSKRYPNGVFGIRDLDFRISPGILGILGPNGAGKSTILQILATTMEPTEGSVLWQGIDVLRFPRRIRKVLGYLPQDFGLPDHLNAVEYLHYMALLKGMDRKISHDTINHLLDIFQLSGVKKRRLSTFSGGMRQRVGIAQSLLNNPDILILDEPMTGLDPEERIRFRNNIQRFSSERIVIISSHIVSEIESLADRIAIVFEGRLVAYKSVSELLDVVEKKVWETVISPDEMMSFQSEYCTTTVLSTKQGVRVRFLSDQRKSNEFIPVSPTLEDAYMFFINSHTRGIRL